MRTGAWCLHGHAFLARGVRLSPKQSEFRAFTIKFSGLTHRIVTDVRVYAAFDPKFQKPSAELRTTALWDTGATRSVISEKVVADLGLVPVGQANVQHAGGTGTSATYLVNFMLPNSVGVVGTLVTAFHPNAGDFGAIVGMDIINKGDLALTHVGGKSCMSFRIPSCDEIDYVVHANNIKAGKAVVSDPMLPIKKPVGRNDPCPCGKRRPDGTAVKYKLCHGT